MVLLLRAMFSGLGTLCISFLFVTSHFTVFQFCLCVYHAVGCGRLELM